ncbi:MAG: response regulator [Ignavibacteriaceae bacterium]
MKKVLLIEDDVALKENLGFILSRNNFSLMTAENGKMGLEIARSKRPDAVVCDIMLPDIDGYQILKSIKKYGDNKNIPFFFISAKSSVIDIEKGMELGADDYLVKPFKANLLINSLNKLFEKRSILNQPLPIYPENITNSINYQVEVEKQFYKTSLKPEMSNNSENFAMNHFLLSRNVSKDYEHFIHQGITIVLVNLNRADLKESLNFQKYLLKIMQHNLNRILVDLSLTNFMDSAFAGALINVGRKLKLVNNGELRVVINPKNSLTNPFLLNQLEKKFKTYVNLNFAINCFVTADEHRDVQAVNL